jgi:hypothetical protein
MLYTGLTYTQVLKLSIKIRQAIAIRIWQCLHQEYVLGNFCVVSIITIAIIIAIIIIIIII